MNIILVVFDSLRKDSVSTYGEPPWGKVQTPQFDKLASESLVMTRAYPESLPTLPTRRALYTGQRVYPFHNADFRLKGDFWGAPGWGPIPEDQPTLAEILKENGYRTGLVADVYHMFKPSKNYWRGFDQWLFLRGQEKDPQRSGPRLSQAELDYWLPPAMQTPQTVEFIQQCIMNMHDRTREEDYFSARVLREAALWLEQNQDADKFFLTVESFDPHEPWLVPAHYRRMYLKEEGVEQVKSGYADTSLMDNYLLKRTRANYSGSVSLCDRWFGFLMEAMRVLGLLENTLLIFTSDHGHSIGDDNYMGKRGYPSRPEVFDIPLMIRHPQGIGAGIRSDMFVQHFDISAEILHSAGVAIPGVIQGKPFFDFAVQGGKTIRDHATVAWGSAITVINDRWWFNCKLDGKGALLYDLNAKQPFSKNVADDNLSVANALFETALADGDHNIPEWIYNLAKEQKDAPGCSDLAARK
ncbi:sulfatase [candidate division KSB1 bacterium]|nr:sulfatase [candidate division KSB1 bacterium]